MNRTTKRFAMLGISALMVLSSIAYIPPAKATGNQITLEELGVLQLAAHDLFNIDRGNRVHADTAKDFENGKLDLSTLFIDMTTGTPFSLDDIKKGGEPRNRENIILFSVASRIGHDYADNINNGDSQQTAQQKALDQYHTLFNSAYLSAFGESVPPPNHSCVTMTENLAFRTVHDFLPEEIVEGGSSKGIFTFIPPFSGTGLTDDELLQPTSMLDGEFDMVFTEQLDIVIQPGVEIHIPSLLQADSDFADQFNTDFSFEFFLSELEDGSYDSNEQVMNQIRNLIAKGYGQGCYIGGEIIPIDSVALLVAGLQSSPSILTALVAVGSVSFGVMYSISKRR